MPVENVVLLFSGTKLVSNNKTVAGAGIRNKSKLMMMASKKRSGQREDVEGAKNTHQTSNATAKGAEKKEHTGHSTKSDNQKNAKHSSNKNSTPRKTAREETPDIPSVPPTPHVEGSGVMQKIEESVEQTKSTLLPEVTSFVNSPPETSEEREKIRLRLQELLLRRVMKLDEFEAPEGASDADEIRKKRKEAIKWTQSLQSQVRTLYTHHLYYTYYLFIYSLSLYI